MCPHAGGDDGPAGGSCRYLRAARSGNSAAILVRMTVLTLFCQRSSLRQQGKGSTA